MDRTRLTALLEEPGRIAVQDLGALRELTERHPWFSGAHVLLATGEQALGEVMAGEHTRDAAAHVPDRGVLFDLAERGLSEVLPPQLSVVRDEPSPVALPQQRTPFAPQVERVDERAPRIPLSDAEIAERILEQQMLEAAIATGYSLEAMVVEPMPEPLPPPVATVVTTKPEPASEEMRAVEPVRPAASTRMRFTDWLDTAAEVKTPNMPFESVGQGDAQDWVRAPKPDTASKPEELPRTPHAEDPSLSAAHPPLTTPPSPARTRDTIDRFLRSATPEQPKRTEFFTPQEAGRRSLREQADMVTETLARIYEQQGNFLKAAEAYRKLALKVPEKAAYFAALSQAAAEKQKKEG
ncbi:MAG: hypothetical protein WAU70_01070 [Flavobacteriales bacterium]